VPQSVPVRLHREPRGLQAKAIDSLRRAAEAFNSFHEDGRPTTVLLHLQHSFEMLLKSALLQRRIPIFDAELGRSIGFKKCLNLGREHLRLTTDEVGTLRAIDALRDEEQHWLAAYSEGILYAYARAGVTLFDDLLQRCFDEHLASYLPTRVLPMSAEPPRDIQLLIDDQFNQIQQLLRPGRRRHADARARIRCLLALEAHVSDDVMISSRDVARVEKGVREGKTRDQTFPKLAEVSSEVVGAGLTVMVRFTKTTGMPVRFVTAAEEAAAVREVDLQRKYHWGKQELAHKLGLSLPRSYALRLYLKIEDDDRCRHDFVFGSTTHRQYSDQALVLMREALASVDMEAVWAEYRRTAAMD
jgi:hypothetical protein